MSMIEQPHDAIGRRRPDQIRYYSEAEKAEAVGLAMSIGDEAAAARLNIPRRNISRWRRSPSPVVNTAIVATEKAIADKLWTAVEVGVTEVLRRMQDPKARLGDLARALEVVSTQHALLSGRVTARTETTVTEGPRLTDEERQAFRDFYDGLINAEDDELDAWLRDGGLLMLRDAVKGVENPRQVTGSEARDE